MTVVVWVSEIRTTVCKRPKTECSVWQTEQKIVRFKIFRLVPSVRKLNKTGSKPVWNRFYVRKPNDFVQIRLDFRRCLKSELFGNRTKTESAEIRMFGFQTFTVVLFQTLNNCSISKQFGFHHIFKCAFATFLNVYESELTKVWISGVLYDRASNRRSQKLCRIKFWWIFNLILWWSIHISTFFVFKIVGGEGQLPKPVVIGVAIGAGLLLFLVIGILILYRRKSTESVRVRFHWILTTVNVWNSNYVSSV